MIIIIFMQGIYTHIPETNYVPREYSVAAILLLLLLLLFLLNVASVQLWWWVGHVARLGRRQMHMGLWWRNLKERAHLQDLDIDMRILQMDLKEIRRKGVKWIQVALQKSCGPLWIRQWTFGGSTMWGDEHFTSCGTLVSLRVVSKPAPGIT